MQWLIDIVKQWVVDQNYLTTGFIDRGDTPDQDFKDADFITDGSWHEMDLSGIIPLGTKAVSIYLYIIDNLTNSYLQFKTRGNVYHYNASQLRTQVANLYNDADLVVIPRSDLKIQYRATNTTFSHIRLTVKGWWL